VLVPVEFLNGERAPERKARDRTLSAPLDNAGEINVLREHVQTLRELFDQQKATHAAELERIDADQTRLIEERTQLQDKLQEVQAEADHAKADQVRMAQDVTGMFDELRAMADRHAELHADRARLEAELERARQDADRQRADHVAELERVRDELKQARRPWWRRLVGR
jgi:chromosome segregation ATPase